MNAEIDEKVDTDQVAEIMAGTTEGTRKFFLL